MLKRLGGIAKKFWGTACATPAKKTEVAKARNPFLNVRMVMSCFFAPEAGCVSDSGRPIGACGGSALSGGGSALFREKPPSWG